MGQEIPVAPVPFLAEQDWADVCENKPSSAAQNHLLSCRQEEDMAGEDCERDTTPRIIGCESYKFIVAQIWENTKLEPIRRDRDQDRTKINNAVATRPNGRMVHLSWRGLFEALNATCKALFRPLIAAGGDSGSGAFW